MFFFLFDQVVTYNTSESLVVSEHQFGEKNLVSLFIHQLPMIETIIAFVEKWVKNDPPPNYSDKHSCVKALFVVQSTKVVLTLFVRDCKEKFKNSKT